MADALTTPRVVAGVAGAAGLIAGLTLLARAAGFGRTLVFADSVRADGVGAVYNSVNALPNVLYEVAAGGVLAAVAVPVIAGHLGTGDADRAHRSASALLTWVLALLTPLAAMLALAAPALAGWVVDESQPGAAAAGTTMLRIFAVQVPLYGIGIVLSGLLQAHRRFLMVALAPLLSSIVVIATYVVYGGLVDGRTAPLDVTSGALRLLAWGTTAGVLALSVPLLVPAVRTGWRWQPTFRFAEGDSVRSRSLAAAGVLALVAQQGCVVATIWVANHRGDTGTLSVYQYIQAVYLLPYAVLAVPVATAAFPALAMTRGAGPDVATSLSRSLRAVFALAGVGAAVLVAVASQVGHFFTALDARRGGGRPSTAALADLPVGLMAYAPGLVGFAVAALLTRALYVRGRPRHAAYAVGAGWLVAALVPLLVLRSGSGPGRTLLVLGVASSVGMTLGGMLLIGLVRSTWGTGALDGVARTAGAVAVAGLAAALVGSLGARVLPWPGAVGSAASGLLTGIVTVGVFSVLWVLLDRDTTRVVAATLGRRRGAA